VADFFGQRFRKNIWLTSHARESMVRRRIDAASLEFVIEQGEIKRRNNTHMWVFKHIEGRTDNLICAAVLEQAAIIIKTVVTNWEQEDEL